MLRLFVWLGGAAFLPGCYAAVGPTVGLDTSSGRMTAGIEASAATLTYAHSMIVSDAPSPGRRSWSSREYLLWEPGLGDIIAGKGDGPFSFAGIGGSLGLRLDHLENNSRAFGWAGGIWTSAGLMLKSGPESCEHEDIRPYAGLVAGYRGGELYLAPKFGVVKIPHICLTNLFGSGGGGF